MSYSGYIYIDEIDYISVSLENTPINFSKTIFGLLLINKPLL